MRRSREATAETRAKAVRAAARLFREKGIDGVGLKEIMHAIGMTHGGFYRHFASKEQLAAEAISAAASESFGNFRQSAQQAEPQRGFAAIVERYLSAGHAAHAEAGCPLAALASDARRQSPPTRAAYTAAIELALTAIEETLESGPKRRTIAIQTLASLVGGLVLAQAADNPKLAAEILRTVREGILKD